MHPAKAGGGAHAAPPAFPFTDRAPCPAHMQIGDAVCLPRHALAVERGVAALSTGARDVYATPHPHP
jgi:hypothetical protein